MDVKKKTKNVRIKLLVQAQDASPDFTCPASFAVTRHTEITSPRSIIPHGTAWHAGTMTDVRTVPPSVLPGVRVKVEKQYIRAVLHGMR